MARLAAVALLLPAAGCGAIVHARASFISKCGQPASDWQSLGAIAYISGVGFWDFPHGQSGHAPNYAELHPVTALRIVSGCNG